MKSGTVIAGVLTSLGASIVALGLSAMIGDHIGRYVLPRLDRQQAEIKNLQVALDRERHMRMAGNSWAEDAVTDIRRELRILNNAVYVDASTIPNITGDGEKSGTEIMGERYPHIHIEGVRLDYDAQDKWYHFVNGGPRAMWMGFGNKRILGTSDRSKNGENLNELVREIEMEEWCPKTHRWIPSNPMGPPVIPPTPRTASATIIQEQ